VIDTFRADNDGEAMARAQENWSGKGVNFGVRAKVAEPEEQKPKSRRAELAQRVTRSTRDVGEQLWRVNHHSSVRWVTARSQADAVKQAIQQDRAFNSAETRARIATDMEKAQWNLDQERQRERDAGRDAEQIRARLGAPQAAGGGEWFQQAQGEWTGRWLIRNANTGELLHAIHGIGNVQSDANRHAAAWLGRNRPDLVGQDVEVVPEMT
jgi:hypothetical protein